MKELAWLKTRIIRGSSSPLKRCASVTNGYSPSPLALYSKTRAPLRNGSSLAPLERDGAINSNAALHQVRLFICEREFVSESYACLL